MDTNVKDPKLEEAGRAILQNVLGDQTFSLDDADLSKMDNVRSLLEISLEFEKDTIIFYEMLMEFIDESNVLVGLKKIVEEEKRHVKRLEDFIEKKEVLPVRGP
jgi:rubrerythrin